MKEMTRKSAPSPPSPPSAPGSDENRRWEADVGSFYSLVVLRHRRRVSSPSAIDSCRSLAYFFVFASADELSGVADNGGRAHDPVRVLSEVVLPAVSGLSHTSQRLAAPSCRPTLGCCRRRLSPGAVAVAVTAAPDHIKLSYSSDNNFRLLHSGLVYSQQWL